MAFWRSTTEPTPTRPPWGCTSLLATAVVLGITDPSMPAAARMPHRTFYKHGGSEAALRASHLGVRKRHFMRSPDVRCFDALCAALEDSVCLEGAGT